MTPHVYLFGTAGEGYAVTDRQYGEIITCFRDALPAETSPMIGVISLSLGTIVERINTAYALGFRSFQISLPSWGALTDPELDRFFAATCGAFPDCAFLHYNLPRAKRLLTGSDYARLAARHPNLVAIKMGGDPATLREILDAAPELQLFCVEFGYAALRDDYECGFITAVTAGNPALAQKFFAARGPQLAQLTDEIRAAHRVLKAAFADSDAHIDGAFDKINAKLLLPEFPLRLLPPYSGSTEAMFEKFCAEAPPGWISRKPASP